MRQDVAEKLALKRVKIYLLICPLNPPEGDFNIFGIIL
jgi:hypothetical protein